MYNKFKSWTKCHSTPNPTEKKNPEKSQEMDLGQCTRIPLADGITEKQEIDCGCNEIRTLDEDSVTHLRCLLQRATVLLPLFYIPLYLHFILIVSKMKCIYASKDSFFTE